MKVLIWNIKFFAKNRIVGQTATTGGSAEANEILTKNDASRALASLSYILGTVFVSDPDVFVVVEPRSSAGFPGTLADPDSAGPAGLITLLAALRSELSTQWCLVPPMRINSTRQDPIDPGSQYTECIGVYWRADRMTFTGPWVNTASGPRPTGTAAPYPGAWANVVPPGTTASGTALFAHAVEGQLQLIGFPDETSRKPFCTTFTEIGGNQRLLELYSLHLDTYDGGRAVDSLMKIPFRDQNKKVILIGGDINVDVSAMTTYEASALGSLDTNFHRLVPGPAVPILGRDPRYPPTVVKPGQSGTPGSYKRTATYDYGFVHYSPNATPTTAPRCDVLDRVAGVPLTYAMAYPLSDFTRTVPPPLTLDTFRGRFNYAKIGEPSTLHASPAVLADGTSDHLPILFTV
jgi:hypothetical protein